MYKYVTSEKLTASTLALLNEFLGVWKLTLTRPKCSFDVGYKSNELLNVSQIDYLFRFLLDYAIVIKLPRFISCRWLRTKPDRGLCRLLKTKPMIIWHLDMTARICSTKQ